MARVLLPVTLKLVLPPEHNSELEGCADMVTGAITVNTAAEEVAGGAQVPVTTQRYLLPFIPITAADCV